MEKEAQLQKEPQQLEHEFASVPEMCLSMPAPKAAQLTALVDALRPAVPADQIHATHAHTRNLLEGLTCMVQHASAADHVQTGASVPAETAADVEAMDESQRSASASQRHIRLLASCVGVSA